MIKLTKKVAIGGVIVVLMGLCVTVILNQNRLRTVAFVVQNTRELMHYSQPKDVPNAYTRTFVNGESVAIRMEHACCSGAGFNATVLYGSDGKVLVDTETCFCGYEEMGSDLDRLQVRSLAEFVRESHLRFHLVRTR